MEVLTLETSSDADSCPNRFKNKQLNIKLGMDNSSNPFLLTDGGNNVWTY